MPAIDGSGRDEMLDLLDACERIAALQNRIVGSLHVLGLVDDTTQLTVIARGDQIDAHIDHVRDALTARSSGSDTVPRRIPTTRPTV
jgi:hypothetical protein